MGSATAAVSALPHRDITAEETSCCSDWPIFSAGEESDFRKTPQHAIKSHCILSYCIALHCIILHEIVLYCIVQYRVVSNHIISYHIQKYQIILFCIVLYHIVLACERVKALSVYCRQWNFSGKTADNDTSVRKSTRSGEKLSSDPFRAPSDSPGLT